MPDTIRVRISAVQQVRYEQEVILTNKEYRDLLTQQKSKDPITSRMFSHEMTSPIGDLLDLRDCDAAGPFEDIRIERVPD